MLESNVILIANKKFKNKFVVWGKKTKDLPVGFLVAKTGMGRTEGGFGR
jgi:hypothetical protein